MSTPKTRAQASAAPDMTAKAWDAMAADFERDVFDPTGTDLRGVFNQALREAGRCELAVDFGCGTGRLLPRLAKQAERIVGIDFSGELLQLARERTADEARIETFQADLTKPLRKPRDADLVTCVNVLLTPDENARRTILRNCRGTLRTGGTLVLVVPSLESALWVIDRHLAWNRREGLTGAAQFRGALETGTAATRLLARGVIDQGGSLTQHFLRESITEELLGLGLRPNSIGRVEYAWDDYFYDPPRLLGKQRPWDWVVSAVRT